MRSLLKETATVSEYANELDHDLDGMEDVPEFVDLDNVGIALDSILAAVERAKIQLTILRVATPADEQH
ncbi:hypothetical protein [Spirillospora sp. CA-294931]|uniref:hypothetical protein n=1 Tax=Spirillospora sp. CA-294931 TaxID=3240042 RepID=UPI003D944414